jgi:hypothetical protein
MSLQILRSSYQVVTARRGKEMSRRQKPTQLALFSELEACRKELPLGSPVTVEGDSRSGLRIWNGPAYFSWKGKSLLVVWVRNPNNMYPPEMVEASRVRISE